jgi:hypothetical protein
MANPNIGEDKLFEVLCLGVSRLQNWALQYIFMECLQNVCSPVILRKSYMVLHRWEEHAYNIVQHSAIFFSKFLYPLALKILDWIQVAQGKERKTGVDINTVTGFEFHKWRGNPDWLGDSNDLKKQCSIKLARTSSEMKGDAVKWSDYCKLSVLWHVDPFLGNARNTRKEQ